MTLHGKATLDELTSQPPSQRLREVLSSIERDLDALTRQIIDNIRKEIPAYAAIDDTAVLADVTANVRENLGIVFESFVEGCDLPAQRFTHVSRFTRKRASQNIPLEAVLRAYRVSCPLIWGSILAAARSNSTLRDEILFKLSPRVLYHFDLFSRVVQQAYSAELRDRFRHHDQAKQELSRLVLDGTADEQTLRTGAAALGLDPAGLYSAVAVELRNAPREPTPDSDVITRVVGVLASAFGTSAQTVVDTLVRGVLVAWLPHPPRPPGSKATDDLAVACAGLFAEDSIAVRAGVSVALRGITNWKIACDQALKALEIGTTVDPARQVHRYASVAIRDLVSRTPEAAGFLRAVLEMLSSDEELLRSADAYFASGRHLKLTAAELGVHRNTLKYRLGRIEQLLGGSFDDADWALRLQLALQLRQAR
jgi:carbohydrate diacid regulator